MNESEVEQEEIALDSIQQIEAEQVGQRLDRFAVGLLHDSSRTAVQQLIAAGLVLVNGKPSKPGYALRADDRVQILAFSAPGRELIAKPNARPLTVVDEFDDIILPIKPAG